ncbi:MAG: aminotransferase class I/II-fold pyridoxal phosphate-dependent enzyme [Blastocatellia bacterium]
MKQSVYMTWAKRHAAARYNLANSGLLAVTMEDLPVRLDDLELTGANSDGYRPLMVAIAAHYQVAADNVVTAQGTSMANFLAMATVLEHGDEVLIEEPAYDPFLSAAAFLGASVKRFARRFEHGWQVDVDELARLITPRTRLIVLSSPHNPSGVVIDQASMRRIGEIAADAHVLVDEVYRDILFEDAAPVSLHLGPQFMVTSSLTKSYGLNGLRCGWVLCEPELAERMRRLNDLFGAVGVMAGDKLSLLAFQHIDRLLARARAIIEPNKQLVDDFLRAHPDTLECVTPARSMIVFPRLKHAADSQPLHDRLRESDTSIVPGVYFGMPRHFRLGFCIRNADVATGLRHLSEALC